MPHALCGEQWRSTQQTKRCRQFAERLSDEAAPAGVRVWWSDENDSSAEAARFLDASGATSQRRDALLDAVAAAVILARAFTRADTDASRPAAVPCHVAPARGVALQRGEGPQKERPGAGMEWYRELKQAGPDSSAPPAPARGVSVELLRRQRGGGAAQRLQSWGELGMDEENEAESKTSPSEAQKAEQLG